MCKRMSKVSKKRVRSVSTLGENHLAVGTFSKNVILVKREAAADGLQKQCQRMLRNTDKVLDEIDIASTVLVPIPHVDRGKGDTRNIKAIVISKSEKGYKLATKDGVIIGHCLVHNLILVNMTSFQ